MLLNNLSDIIIVVRYHCESHHYHSCHPSGRDVFLLSKHPLVEVKGLCGHQKRNPFDAVIAPLQRFMQLKAFDSKEEGFGK
jgi:hypothetical protein